MVFASWDDYQASSLRDYMRVSKRLVEALGLPSRSGMVEEFNVADSLSRELGIPEDAESESVYRFVLRLVPALEHLLDSGKLTPTDSARDVAATAAEDLDFARTMDIAECLGWMTFDLSRPAQQIRSVDDIEPAMRDMLTQRLERQVFDMLSRWHRTGAWANRPRIVRDLESNGGESG